MNSFPTAENATNAVKSSTADDEGQDSNDDDHQPALEKYSLDRQIQKQTTLMLY